MFGGDLVERTPGDLRSLCEPILDEHVERAIHRRLVQLRNRLRDLAGGQVSALRMDERVPDQRTLPRHATPTGANRHDVLERMRRVRVRLHRDSSCALQRRSIPRTFQTTAETIQVAAKRPTTR